MWRDLGAAVALLLMLEGLMPFLYPGGWRRMLGSLAQASDGALRVGGLVSMLLGLALLYILR